MTPIKDIQRSNLETLDMPFDLNVSDKQDTMHDAQFDISVSDLVGLEEEEMSDESNSVLEQQPMQRHSTLN